MGQQRTENRRYGVDIWGPSTHAEVNALEQIFELLECHAGHVLVLDRKNRARVFEGSVEEVRSELLRYSGQQCEALGSQWRRSRSELPEPSLGP